MDDELREWIEACDEDTGAQPHMDLEEWLWVSVTMLAVGGLLGLALAHLLDVA